MMPTVKWKEEKMNKESFKLLAIVTFLLVGVTFSFYLGWKNSERKPNASEYQFIVTDDSITVYDGSKTIGTVRLEGQLDSLITDDNQ